jgi:phage terminase small subunit
MENSTYKTIDGLKTHPLYGQLSEKQQKFLISYLENNGNRTLAASAAYVTDKPQSMGLKLLRHPVISKLIAIYHDYGIPNVPMSKTELIGLIAGRLRDEKTSGKDFVALVTQYVEIALNNRSLKKKMSEETEVSETPQEPEVDIDTLVRQLEKKPRKK